jgi:hypothetical protein
MVDIRKQGFAQQIVAQAATFLIAFVVVCVLPACTPAFNWREVSFEGLPVLALLPCKPDRATRSVPLADGPQQMVMAGCEAGGATFTVAIIDMGSAGKVAPAVAQLRAANKATHSQYALHGTVLVQASIYGTPKADRDGPSALSTQAVDTFFSGIQLLGKR